MRGWPLREFLSRCLPGAAATGCTSIFHLDEYSTADPDGSPSPGPIDGGDEQCVGPSGTSACTGGGCIPFDNVARIGGFAPDASLPSLPDASPGAGTIDAGAG